MGMSKDDKDQFRSLLRVAEGNLRRADNALGKSQADQGTGRAISYMSLTIQQMLNTLNKLVDSA
jgi:hypothetical protein